MAHFYESMTIQSEDGIQFKSYANEHPDDFIIAKPKYIPRQKIDHSDFQARNIQGRDVRRFDYWASSEERLGEFIKDFRRAYPDYVYDCPLHNTWFMGVPPNKIASLPDPKDGVQKILAMKQNELDEYMKKTQALLNLLVKEGFKESELGVINSTLLGNYTYGRSDIDIVIYGKKRYWDYINFIQTVEHPWLRWKTVDEWKKYFSTYNAGLYITEEEFIWHAQRKYSDGFFGEIVISVFGVEESDEVSVKWGDEKYTPMGLATVRGVVKNNFHSVVRPGYYEMEDSKIILGPDVTVTKIVTYARDFLLQAHNGEIIEASGILEKVEPLRKEQGGKEYYRIVIGYFDSYINRRCREYIKVIE